MKIGLRFIRVVKTATKYFPMTYLSSVEFDQGRGKREVAFIKTDGIVQMMAYSWMNHDRRCVISTSFSLSYGRPYSRVRWRQQERDDEHFGQANNEEALREELVVEQPKCWRFIMIRVQQYIITITTDKTYCV